MCGLVPSITLCVPPPVRFAPLPKVASFAHWPRIVLFDGRLQFIQLRRRCVKIYAESLTLSTAMFVSVPMTNRQQFMAR